MSTRISDNMGGTSGEEHAAPEQTQANETPEPPEGEQVEETNGSNIEEPVDELSVLREELEATRNKMLRALAEVENIRRRAERDRKDAEAYGGTRLARDMLVVYDNMERALKALPGHIRESASEMTEGLELTQRELLIAFAKHKIAPIAPELGERFDPNCHQAMFEAPIPSAEPGTIIQIMQTGFSIADRLLRPAYVLSLIHI